jgi:hypothetical protein
VLITRLSIVKNSVTDFDTYGHLYFAKEVRSQSVGPFGAIIPKVVAGQPYRHPFLWHWLIGVLSFDFFYRNKKWINAFIDSFFVLIVYAIIQISFTSEIALFCSLLYIFTPNLFSAISTGPRIKSLTPRITSEIAVNLYFIFLLIPLPVSNYFSYTLAIMFGVFTLLSSKFGIQAIFLLSISIALLLQSLLILGVLIVAILICFIITKGQFVSTLKDQGTHLVWYFKKNLKGEMSISKRNSLSLFREKSKDKKGILKIGTILLHLIRTNSFGVIIFKMPVLLVCLSLFIYFKFVSVQTVSLVPVILMPVLAGVFIFLAVNIPILLFIGEAERYLNHIIVFVFLMTTISAFGLNMVWILWALIGYGFLFWLFELFVYNTIIHKKFDGGLKEVDEKEIIDFLRTINSEKIVLSFPYHAVGIWRIMLETIHKTVYPIMVTKEFSEKFETNYDAGYPFVDLNKINEMNNDFGLDILIIDNKQVAKRYGKMWTPPENWVKEPVSGEIYTLYKNSYK